MKIMQIDVPDQLAKEMEALVKAGWFSSEAEIARLALVEFIRRYRFELLERFQREDIAWAIRQKRSASPVIAVDLPQGALGSQGSTRATVS